MPFYPHATPQVPSSALGFFTKTLLKSQPEICARENGASSGPGLLATYAYDNLGRRYSIARGNGSVTNYSYDPVSRLSTLTHDLSGSTHDQTLSFGYNPAGQIDTATRSNDAYAWGQHYNIDRSYGSNGLNQLTSAGATPLGYDPRGNLTSSGSSSYSYTAEDRFATASNGTYVGYEPSGNQIIQLYSSATGADTRFGWDGNQINIELAANSGWVTLRRYVPGDRADETIVWYEGSGLSDRRWLHADEQGSVVAVTNGSGSAIAINSYDEYGIPTSTNLGRFGYTGQAWLPELGMNYYKARIYSPTLGRFLQSDPIGYADGMNWYNYVGSDPINGTDPSGTDCIGVNNAQDLTGGTGSGDCSGGWIVNGYGSTLGTPVDVTGLNFATPFTIPSFGNLPSFSSHNADMFSFSKGKSRSKPGKTRRGSTECATTVGIVAGSATIVGIEAPAYLAVGRAALQGARIGAHGGLGGIVAGVVIGGIVGGAVYYYNLDDKPVINQLSGCGGNSP